MLERLNLGSLKKMDMSDVKSCAKTYASNAKSYAKVAGRKAMQQARYIGNKRVWMAGRSVNPFLVGAAAVALISGAVYLLLRNRHRKMELAGMTEMEHQEYPVK